LSTGADNLNESARRTVALFIPALEMGGAERQLIELAKGIDKTKWNVLILTNFVNPTLSDELTNREGIRIVLLKREHKFLYPFRLLGTLYREKPCILNAYLLGAQAYALFIRPFAPGVKLVFSIRDAIDYSTSHIGWERFFRLLLEKSTPLVDYYLFNSMAGRREKSFLPDSKTQVIPNGIDTFRFSPDHAARSLLEKEAGIGAGAPLVGIVGNVSRYKGYDTLIRAARNVVDTIPETRFIAIGNIDTDLGREMAALVRDLGLAASFRFLGARRDVHRLLPGFDLLCSSSVTEGFSNAICEGMACGLPCVVTDVGDSAIIVGDTGIVVPPSDPDALATGIIRLLRTTPEDRLMMGDSARARIVEQFSIPRMVAATEKVFEQLVTTR